MKSVIKWFNERDAADFSFTALFIIAFSQFFTISLFRQANAKIFIDNNPSYISHIEYEGSSSGRSSSVLYRLRYDIDSGNDIKSCNVVKHYNYDPNPYFGKQIRVTPRGYDCENPYLTDLEYRPLFTAVCGACLTSLASLFLLISAIKLNEKAKYLRIHE